MRHKLQFKLPLDTILNDKSLYTIFKLIKFKFNTYIKYTWNGSKPILNIIKGKVFLRLFNFKQEFFKNPKPQISITENENRFSYLKLTDWDIA